MWHSFFLQLKFCFKRAGVIAACFLVVTAMVSRSFVTRPSLRLQRVLSVLEVSRSSPSSIVTDNTEEGDSNPRVVIGKRVRDEEDPIKKLGKFSLRKFSFSPMIVSHDVSNQTIFTGTTAADVFLSAPDKPPKFSV